VRMGEMPDTDRDGAWQRISAYQRSNSVPVKETLNLAFIRGFIWLIKKQL